MVGKCEWGESERQSGRLSAIKRVGYVVLLPGPDGGRQKPASRSRRGAGSELRN
jgi:hypothetical protein